jgi:hypothetical protein
VAKREKSAHLSCTNPLGTGLKEIKKAGFLKALADRRPLCIGQWGNRRRVGWAVRAAQRRRRARKKTDVLSGFGADKEAFSNSEPTRARMPSRKGGTQEGGERGGALTMARLRHLARNQLMYSKAQMAHRMALRASPQFAVGARVICVAKQWARSTRRGESIEPLLARCKYGIITRLLVVVLQRQTADVQIRGN